MHLRRIVLPVLLAALLAPAALAATKGAEIDKTGWWQRANTGPVNVPPPPGIPEGDLVVAAAANGVSMLSAVGIKPEAAQGATIKRFVLRLSEDTTAAGNQNSAAGAINACPITAFWAGGANGRWESRPQWDCSVAVSQGVRGRDGTWTFDLRPVGEVWLDPFGTVRADGVALIADVQRMSAPFEAVFLGGDHIDVILEIEESGVEAGSTESFTRDLPRDTSTNVGLSSAPGGGGGGSLFAPPAIAAPPTTLVAPSVSVVSSEVEQALNPTVPEASAPPGADRRGQFIGNWSPGLGAGLILLVALLLAMSWWLGPIGEPARHHPQRGVSRALELQMRWKKESL